MSEVSLSSAKVSMQIRHSRGLSWDLGFPIANKFGDLCVLCPKASYADELMFMDKHEVSIRAVA